MTGHQLQRRRLREPKAEIATSAPGPTSPRKRPWTRHDARAQALSPSPSPSPLPSRIGEASEGRRMNGLRAAEVIRSRRFWIGNDDGNSSGARCSPDFAPADANACACISVSIFAADILGFVMFEIDSVHFTSDTLPLPLPSFRGEGVAYVHRINTYTVFQAVTLFHGGSRLPIYRPAIKTRRAHVCPDRCSFDHSQRVFAYASVI